MTKLSKISILVFIITFLVQIVVSNHLAVKTQEFNDTQEHINEVKNQISAVNQEIYTLSSITGMEERALNSGFSHMNGSVKSIINPTVARAL